MCGHRHKTQLQQRVVTSRPAASMLTGKHFPLSEIMAWEGDDLFPLLGIPLPTDCLKFDGS